MTSNHREPAGLTVESLGEKSVGDKQVSQPDTALVDWKLLLKVLPRAEPRQEALGAGC